MNNKCTVYQKRQLIVFLVVYGGFQTKNILTLSIRAAIERKNSQIKFVNFAFVI